MFYGYGGLVDRIVEKINEEVGSDLKLFATGGMGALILPYCKTKFDYDIHLTVSGMRKIYDLTK